MKMNSILCELYLGNFLLWKDLYLSIVLTIINIISNVNLKFMFLITFMVFFIYLVKIKFLVKCSILFTVLIF